MTLVAERLIMSDREKLLEWFISHPSAMDGWNASL
jgi:hypothetical protein